MKLKNKIKIGALNNNFNREIILGEVLQDNSEIHKLRASQESDTDQIMIRNMIIGRQ